MVCGRLGYNEGGVVGYVDQIGTKYTSKWGVQMAEMNFQTHSKRPAPRFTACPSYYSLYIP